jgi:hypothetical protein
LADSPIPSSLRSEPELSLVQEKRRKKAETGRRFFMRIQAWVGLIMAGLLVAGTAAAENNSPRVEALGNPVLVMEDETTVLSLFNFGNPAAAAFLPQKNRMDWLALVGNETREADFISNTPGATLTQKTSSLFASLDDWKNTGYGGLIYWLTPQGMIQVNPVGHYQKAVSADTPDDVLGTGGGSFRTAWLLTDDLSAGASVTVQSGQEKGLNLEQPDPISNSLTPLASDETMDRNDVEVSAGMAWRINTLFDAKDRLDAGVQITGASLASQFQRDFPTLAGPSFQPHVTSKETDYPWSATLQSVYDYQNVLDASLVVAYQKSRQFISWESSAFNDRQTFVASELENWNYEVNLRVKLPMVHEDDLRFGIVFNNQPVGHPFPSGRLSTTDATGKQLPDIDTASSSIGIGMAFVPGEGSLITLQYELGSTLSRQAGVRVSDSGFTQASVGAQYCVIPGLYLRAGWVDQQVTFQSDPNFPPILTQIVETDSLRFGVGVEKGALRIDLTAIGARTLHSPLGWEFPVNPNVGPVTKDNDSSTSGLLSVSYLF